MKINNANKNKKGFTLIEMLAVVLIIAVLAAISLPMYQKYILKSRAAEAVNLIEMVKQKQNVIFAKSEPRAYVETAAGLAPLTSNSSEVASNGDLLVNDNYTVTLDSTNQCVIVIYKEDNVEKFRFGASYTEPGIGCNGSICSGFTSVTTDVASVCVRPAQVQGCVVEDNAHENCETGYYFNFSDSICGCVQCPNECPADQVRNAKGCGCHSLQCGECPGNQIQTSPYPDCDCDCPKELPNWNVADQICEPDECPSNSCRSEDHFILDEANAVPPDQCPCICQAGYELVGDKCVSCTDICGNVFDWTDGGSSHKCVHQCQSGTVWNGTACVSCSEIDENRPFFNTDSVGADNFASYVPPDNESAHDCWIQYNQGCEACPDKTVWNGTSCESCPDNKPLFFEGQCYDCSDIYNGSVASASVANNAHNNLVMAEAAYNDALKSGDDKKIQEAQKNLEEAQRIYDLYNTLKNMVTLDDLQKAQQKAEAAENAYKAAVENYGSDNLKDLLKRLNDAKNDYEALLAQYKKQSSELNEAANALEAAQQRVEALKAYRDNYEQVLRLKNKLDGLSKTLEEQKENYEKLLKAYNEKQSDEIKAALAEIDAAIAAYNNALENYNKIAELANYDEETLNKLIEEAAKKKEAAKQYYEQILEKNKKEVDEYYKAREEALSKVAEALKAAQQAYQDALATGDDKTIKETLEQLNSAQKAYDQALADFNKKYGEEVLKAVAEVEAAKAAWDEAEKAFANLAGYDPKKVKEMLAEAQANLDAAAAYLEAMQKKYAKVLEEYEAKKPAELKDAYKKYQKALASYDKMNENYQALLDAFGGTFMSEEELAKAIEQAEKEYQQVYENFKKAGGDSLDKVVTESQLKEALDKWNSLQTQYDIATSYDAEELAQALQAAQAEYARLLKLYNEQAAKYSEAYLQAMAAAAQSLGYNNMLEAIQNASWDDLRSAIETVGAEYKLTKAEMVQMIDETQAAQEMENSRAELLALLRAQFGSGPIWNSESEQCEECWQVDESKPVWNGSTCDTCANVYKAEVYCSAPSSSGTTTQAYYGYMGGDMAYSIKGGSASDRSSGTSTSVPERKKLITDYGDFKDFKATKLSQVTRFSDYLAIYNAQNLDAYALQSGALLAADVGPGGNPNCGAQYAGYISVEVPSTTGCEPGSRLGGGAAGGVQLPACYCVQEGYWVSTCTDAVSCPCGEVPRSQYSFVSTAAKCTANYQTEIFPQGFFIEEQQDCSHSWHGAYHYEPAKPVWNSEKKQCESCQAWVNACSETGQRDTWSGSYWDGSKCQAAILTGNSYIDPDTNVMVVGSTFPSQAGDYDLPMCGGVKTSIKTITCDRVCDEENNCTQCEMTIYQGPGLTPSEQMQSPFSMYEPYDNLYSTWQEEIGHIQSVFQVREPYTKKYVALKELGLSPALADETHVNVHY